MLLLAWQPASTAFCADDSVDWWLSGNGYNSNAIHFGTTQVDQSPSGQLTDSDVVNTALLQPQPPLLPRQQLQPQVGMPAAARLASSNLFGTAGFGRSLLGQPGLSGRSPATDLILGIEAKTRVTTDAGSLLGKSQSALGVEVQRRTPIVNDPRVRGSRVGQLAASGSYWVPARMDLDTVLSKIDSRNIEEILVFKGPYSSLYGPGLHFVDVELLRSPRCQDGFHSHGSTSFDYKTNGQPWYGRQALWGGSADFGYRFAYGQATANDYVTGAGTGIPSSYKSRDALAALGWDLTPNSSLEFSYLRLDQTDVEFPGMVFDMDFLVTDGFELEYTARNQAYYDRLEVEGWYNRTRFDGNAQNPAKRQQFPLLDFIHYVGFTDVDSASLGYRVAMSWGYEETGQFTLGTDLRHIKQELNEVASGRFGFNVFTDANSPIPKSRSSNPGIFLERTIPVGERLRLTAGGRIDWVSTNVIDDPAKLENLGLQTPQSSLAEILGNDLWLRHFTPWSLYATGEYDLSCHWRLLGAAGHGERPPSLTALYAAEPFLLLLQNGLNTVTGDPRLRPERVWQVDLGMRCEYPRFRGGLNGFFAWYNDYITFENMSVFRGPPAGQIEQINLKFVNTARATIAGLEMYGEYDLSDWISPFAILTFREGRDLTRDGEFATQQASAGTPSVRVAGLPRGFFSGIPGAPAEPLPGIYPLDSRVGVRFHQPGPEPQWSMELSARIVGRQSRVATSLLESPTSGFTVWDLRTYWQPTPRLLLVAGVENFTDRNYQEHLDFRSPTGQSVFQPGINFYTGGEVAY